MNRHDKLFKLIVSDPENATDLIQGAVPSDITAKLQLDTLQPEKDSFIDKNLRESFSDLIFSCQTVSGKPARISLLLEHKSYRPQYEHPQILSYMSSIWLKEIREHNQLTLVIAVIICHSKKSWKSRPFRSVFPEHEECFSQFIPDFKYLIYNISEQLDREIKSVLFKRDLIIALNLLLKYSRSKIFLEKLPEIFTELRSRMASDPHDPAVSGCLIYILQTTDISLEQLTGIMQNSVPEGDSTMISTAQQLINKGKLEGKYEGKLEGKHEGKLETAKNLLKLGVDIETIIKATGLPREEIEKLR